MATLVCPNCRSTNLRRSRARGFKESALELFGRKPFKCKDCGWRGIMKSSEGSGKRVSKKKTYAFAVLFSFIILALLVIINLRPEVIEKIVRSLIGSPK